VNAIDSPNSNCTPGAGTPTLESKSDALCREHEAENAAVASATTNEATNFIMAARHLRPTYSEGRAAR